MSLLPITTKIPSRLTDCGFRDVTIVDENCITARWDLQASQLALPALAREFGGSWWPADDHVSWNRGPKPGLTILRPNALEGASEAREAASELELGYQTWNTAGIARKLLEWIRPEGFIPWMFRGGGTDALRLQPGAFTMFKPGLYPDLSLYDLCGAYWQMVERLPSLMVAWSPGGTGWPPGTMWTMLDGDAEARWRDVKAVCRGRKRLRLMLHGSMIGVMRERTIWTKSGPKVMPPRPGPYANAGWLTKRAVYEVTMLQSTFGYYANTDCVMLDGIVTPVLWQGLGLEFRREARGEAHIRGIGCYRIGEKPPSLPYLEMEANLGIEFVQPLCPLPAELTYRSWL